MTRGELPLISRQISDSDVSQNIAEEDGLLTGEKVINYSQPRWKRWIEMGFFAWAILATIIVAILAVSYHRAQIQHAGEAKPQGKRNLVFMVSDGMGPTSLSLTRSFQQYQKDSSWSDLLTLDSYSIGQSRTRSTSSLVTDSAAGATAFSCGFKSYNGAISVLPDHSPCGTVLEAAKKEGYMTGLVVTTRITDATPACFAAHVNKRTEEDRIAEQLLGDYPLGRVVDLMLGGGQCRFLSKSTKGSCRDDDRDLVEEAKNRGFEYIDTREQFNLLDRGRSTKLPLLGLFANRDIPYEIDRRYENSTYPSLKEMAETALNALKKATEKSDKGFFLMIEGSRIDHAGHANDPAAQVHEVLAYNDAFASVLEFIKNEPTPTLMVGTSDHETGGLATARQLHEFEYPSYKWFPSVLANASHSASWLSQDYQTHLDQNESDLTEYLEKVIPEHLGIHDVSKDEIHKLIAHAEYSQWIFADIISRRSQIGWSTHGHSAADVNIYTSNRRQARSLMGNHENTEVGKFLSNWLDVDVDAITEELKRKGTQFDQKLGKSWMGKIPSEAERLDGQDHLDHYAGDYGLPKKRRTGEGCNCGL